MWGLGQRPNCFSGAQLQGSPQQRSRQRSVPASNFAHPQMRPPSCSTSYLHIVAPNGRDHAAGLADIAALSRKQEISPLRRQPKGNENRRSLRSPFGNLRSAHPCFLTSIGTFSVHAAAFPQEPPKSPSNFPFPGIFLPLRSFHTQGAHFQPSSTPEKRSITPCSTFGKPC